LENYIREITIEVEKSCLDFKIGGPFGALVLKDGKVIGRGVNRVIGKHDPTAHAEMEAIRDACINLKTHDLTGCELYATGFPCPMCMSAIIWANIKKVYYSADYKDAEAIGFRDSYIYNFIKEGQKNKDILELVEVNKDSIIDIYKKFVETKGEIY
jgi:tRNA(Arg) A34 adenosine deaminase TadA